MRRAILISALASRDLYAFDLVDAFVKFWAIKHAYLLISVILVIKLLEVVKAGRSARLAEREYTGGFKFKVPNISKPGKFILWIAGTLCLLLMFLYFESRITEVVKNAI